MSGFFLVKIVTCGVSIDGLEETSLHDKVEKERHRFPDVLQKKLMHQHVKYHSKQENKNINVIPDFQTFSVQRLWEGTL